MPRPWTGTRDGDQVSGTVSLATETVPDTSSWRLLLVANVAATLPDAEAAPLEPAQPRCCPACGGRRLVYRELTPAQATVDAAVPHDSS